MGLNDALFGDIIRSLFVLPLMFAPKTTPILIDATFPHFWIEFASAFLHVCGLSSVPTFAPVRDVRDTEYYAAI